MAAPSIAIAVAGCATFHTQPLNSGRGPHHVADLTVSAASMPIPTLRKYTFDPANGLDVTEVAMLAVANNPKLRVERDKLGVAQAQAYKAGLLPDPQVSYEHQRPTSNQPNLVDSFNFGLALNLGNLVTRSARVASARAGARQVNLDLLWSEWQTIAQARSLFDQVYFLRRDVARLERERDALAPIQSAITQALRAGNLTYESASSGLNAASSVATQLAAATRKLHLAGQNLHTLVGLDASVSLQLTGPPFSVDPDHPEVKHALAVMAQRRPDLLALQAGYQSQQEKLRAAILAQFPAITIGFMRARDTSNIYSAGFSIGLSLPLFDGNRGNIAIARATRQQLHDAYSLRLLTDRNDVQRLFADLQTDRNLREALAPHAARLDRARAAAQTAYAAGRLVWPTYLAIRAKSLATDTALLTLEQNIHATAIALDALVGGWPQATTGQRQARLSSSRPGIGRDPDPGTGKAANNAKGSR